MDCRTIFALCFGVGFALSSVSAAEFERISENLFVCRDTCNVYVVKSGADALLIDFGAGKILKHLPGAGIDNVDWTLHTNFFRRKCQGDELLTKLGVRLAVPAKQREFFEDAQGSWDRIKVHHSYNFKPGPFIPTRSVPVDNAIEAGEDFEWKGIVFSTLANAGPTEIPGLTYLAEIDGARVAFTGDLIHSPGKIWDYSELQWKYNAQLGAERTIKSLLAVKEAKPDVLLPSTGVAMGDPAGAIDATIESLREVIDVVRVTRTASDNKGGRRLDGTTPLPHVFHRFTSYFIIADNGRALIYDFPREGQKGEALLEEMRLEHGLKQVDIVMASHYHDDHVDGIPELIEATGAELWAMEPLADVMRNPYTYNIPCLGQGTPLPKRGLRIDRLLREGEEFEWEGWKFSVHHFPGQTEYHQGLFAEIDGRRAIFMGDSTYRPAGEAIFRGENVNCRNYCQLGEGTGYRKCAEVMLKLKPDIALAAHFGFFDLNEKRLNEYADWGKRPEATFAKTIARDNPNFGTDPNWLSIYPYRNFSKPGDVIEFEVRVRNYSDHCAQADIKPVLPAGWTISPKSKAIEIAANQNGAAKFALRIPDDRPLPKRSVVTANVVFDGVDYGEYADMVIDSEALRASWLELYKSTRATRGSPKKKANVPY